MLLKGVEGVISVKVSCDKRGEDGLRRDGCKALPWASPDPGDFHFHTFSCFRAANTLGLESSVLPVVLPCGSVVMHGTLLKILHIYCVHRKDRTENRIFSRSRAEGSTSGQSRSVLWSEQTGGRLVLQGRSRQRPHTPCPQVLTPWVTVYLEGPLDKLSCCSTFLLPTDS